MSFLSSLSLHKAALLGTASLLEGLLSFPPKFCYFETKFLISRVITLESMAGPFFLLPEILLFAALYILVCFEYVSPFPQMCLKVIEPTLSASCTSAR